MKKFELARETFLSQLLCGSVVKVDVKKNSCACATLLTAAGSESRSLTNLERSALKCKTAMKLKALE